MKQYVHLEIKKYLEVNKCKDKNLDELDNFQERLNISYVRVSTVNQKDDLEKKKIY